MANDELDDDERELIRKHRASKERENFRARIRDDKGNEAELPYHKAKGWLQKTFGIDLDQEPKQDGDAVGGGDADADGDGKVKRFQSGRRVG